jgi:serine/threonine-protein kinase RsbT
MGPEATVEIRHESDILAARKVARSIATRLKFSEIDLILIATAISEIARNILTYASQGDMSFEEVQEPARRGLIVTARDRGPGIADIERAMEDGFSSGKGLGLGLPGAKRLMDEFSIASTVGTGTTIVMKKWAK